MFGARSSTDRASDYGSEGLGFESLRAHQHAAANLSVDHGFGGQLPLERTFPTRFPGSAKCEVIELDGEPTSLATSKKRSVLRLRLRYQYFSFRKLAGAFAPETLCESLN